MGKIIISENVTLDGVIQDPAGDEGLRRGGWVGRIGDRGREEAAKVALDEALGTEAMLLGRRTYEFLAARWPSRTGALADRLNSKAKFVVSSTLQHPAWNNTTVLRGDVVREASRLKQHVTGDIVVAGSFQLLQTLLDHDLVDELRLMIYPVYSGSASAFSPRPATRNPCASSEPRPSRATSPSLPTSLSARLNGKKLWLLMGARGRLRPNKRLKLPGAHK